MPVAGEEGEQQTLMGMAGIPFGKWFGSFLQN
jgi:hypothetical protein